MNRLLLNTVELKKLLLLALSILISLHLPENVMAQHQTNMGGVVKNNKMEPLPFVSIKLKNTVIGTTTNEMGFFEIKGLKPGNYILIFSYVGYKSQEREVVIGTHETYHPIEVILQEDGNQLTEVVVSDGKINPFDGKASEYPARMPLSNLENPQVYNVVTKELMREQQIVGFDDALKNATGVHKLWSATGRGGDGAGYYSMRGFSVQPSLMNGVAGISNGSPDPANIEQIETIKGPSGTLFGGSIISFGGLINIVTKKPYEGFGGEISYTAGTFGLNRITADINTPLGDNDKVHLRVNTAYHHENSFLDAGFRTSKFLAPSLSYKVNERLSFSVQTEFYQAESTNPLMIFLNRSRPLTANSPAGLGLDFNRSYTSNDITIQTPTTNIYAQANYKISSKWTSQTNVSRSLRQAEGFYQYSMFAMPGDSLLTRYVSLQDSKNLVTTIQQNFIGDFSIGSLRNRLVVGLDYFHQQGINNNSAYIPFDTVSTLRADPRYIQLTSSALNARLANNQNPSKTETNVYTYSAYFSDVINLTERMMAMMSLRLDRFDNKGSYNQRTNTTSGEYMQTALSPKLGLVYQVLKKRASIFGNYMNGFQNVAPITQPDGSVEIFNPQHANQWELGVKTELFDGKLTGSVSYYDIYVKNVTRPDPERIGFNIQDGNISSKGLEFEVIANPINGLNILLGYTHNESKNDRTAEGINGRRPVSAGPENLANAWVSYRISNSRLQGLGFGAGFNYASENHITNSQATGIFTLPAYTVFGSTMFYDTTHYRLGLKIDNLTNQQYWGGWTTIEPQMPRRILASMAFKF
ncbi:TonB-dependent receptor [Belliella sp. DSM 111904]|uniref:TonB-dependent receptor n=1 Tax=Belliella filtrata TaxID=2923435 RepID=A0ABS9UZC9_9BACT|nr:TonB-dependent receptor [Belliella filtrata]MCH7409517.1 TonB-dependent receptor [Belliella filtrata]